MIKQFLTIFVLFVLRVSARIQLTKMHPTIIGVAGSSGKTSLVALIQSVLQEKYTVLATTGQNSEIGLPLFLLGITIYDNSFFDWVRIILLIPLMLLFNWKTYDILVAEMGIDSPVEPKNMEYLLRFIKPHIMIVTNVSLEHSVYFEPFAKKQDILTLTAEQETLPLTLLEKEEIGIINLDDPLIAAVPVRSKKITLSLEKDADLIGKNITSNLETFSMDILYKNELFHVIINQPLPKHFAYEFLFTIAASIAVEISIVDAIQLLQKNFHLPAGRLSFFRGIDNTILIDSTYNNATLPPVMEILDFVKEISGKRRKIAILGDMRELGEEAEAIHQQVAKKILETVDFVILIGPLSEKYIAPILEKENFPFEDFPDVTSSKKAILNLTQENDIILVKGSQNTLFLERIVEMLLENKEDVKKLTRRGAFWDKKRSDSL